MAYNKTTWNNGVTQLNSTNMNKIEQGIYDNDIGKISNDNGSVTDLHIGDRTLNQSTATAFSNTGKLTQILSWIVKIIKSITGKTNWYDIPTKSLEGLNTDKIDKTSITTSLTETVVGKVVDATIAKNLDDKISILSTDLGNKTSLLTTVKTSIVLAINDLFGKVKKREIFNAINLNTVIRDAYGYCYSCTNTPVSDNGWFNVHMVSADSATQTFTAYVTGFKYERVVRGNVFSSWSQLATTDKIDISLPLSATFVATGIYSSKIVKQNNRATIYFDVKLANGAIMPSGTAYYNVVNLPTGFLSGVNTIVSCSSGADLSQIAHVALYANSLVIQTVTACSTITGQINYEVVG